MFRKNDDDQVSSKEMRAQAKALRHSPMGQQGAAAGGVAGRMQAALAAASAAQGMDLAGLTTFGQTTQRINAAPADGAGTISAVRSSSPLGGSGRAMFVELDVAVTSGPGAPQTVTIKQPMSGDPSAYAVGAEVKLRINASNPAEAMISAHPGSGTPTVITMSGMGMSSMGAAPTVSGPFDTPTYGYNPQPIGGFPPGMTGAFSSIGGVPSTTPPAADDTVSKLERLAKLRDSGAITNVEFEQQKAKILGG